MRIYRALKAFIKMATNKQRQNEDSEVLVLNEQTHEPTPYVEEEILATTRGGRVLVPCVLLTFSLIIVIIVTVSFMVRPPSKFNIVCEQDNPNCREYVHFSDLQAFGILYGALMPAELLLLAAQSLFAVNVVARENFNFRMNNVQKAIEMAGQMTIFEKAHFCLVYASTLFVTSYLYNQGFFTSFETVMGIEKGQSSWIVPVFWTLYLPILWWGLLRRIKLGAFRLYRHEVVEHTKMVGVVGLILGFTLEWLIMRVFVFVSSEQELLTIKASQKVIPENGQMMMQGVSTQLIGFFLVLTFITAEALVGTGALTLDMISNFVLPSKTCFVIILATLGGVLELFFFLCNMTQKEGWFRGERSSIYTWVLAVSVVPIWLVQLFGTMIELNRKGDALTKELGPDGARDGTRCLMLSYAWGPLAPGTNDVHPNQEKVKVLKKKLEQRGYRCWLDLDYMDHDMTGRMMTVIGKCDAVIACVTPEYNRVGSNANMEFLYALQQNKKVFGLRMNTHTDMTIGDFGFRRPQAKYKWYNFAASADTTEGNQQLDKAIVELVRDLEAAYVYPFNSDTSEYENEP
eukprot:m.211104 g.211104  ORF g.211104 m.211104 type:complete len:573 (-) comp15832_c0_seq4:4060-5778(-)